jgi:hypothetical protein
MGSRSKAAAAGTVALLAWPALTGPYLAQSGPDRSSFATVASCRVRGDAKQRVYELRTRGAGTEAQWQLTMRGPAANERETIVLPLPHPATAVAPGRVSLSYHSANGGRDVQLDVDPGHATLDVSVDHGLEVNVDPDLDPRVDLMSTQGPQPADCTVTPIPAREQQ